MISINDLQKLLGKKSKEQASGAISKLSADEWNTLVQGVIEHYGLLALNAEANTVTIKDPSGISHIYDLTPHANIVSRYYTITGINDAENPSFTVPNNIPATGTKVATSLKYKALKHTVYSNNNDVTEVAEVIITYSVVDTDAGLSIDTSGKVSCNANSDASRTVGTVKVSISIKNPEEEYTTASWESSPIEVNQNAYEYPDYYIGFYSNPEDYQSASSDALIENARAYDTISNKSVYPSASNYIYYSGNEKLMYLIYNKSCNILIDVDNPGTSFDLTNQTINDVAMTTFNKSDFVKNGKTYGIMATFDATNTSENGYRFKFTTV